LNGDGVPDLAVIDTSGTLHLSVLLGRGDGTFRRQVAIATNLSAAPGAMNPTVRIADVNGDGMADLAGFGLAGVTISPAHGFLFV